MKKKKQFLLSAGMLGILLGQVATGTVWTVAAEETGQSVTTEAPLETTTTTSTQVEEPVTTVNQTELPTQVTEVPQTTTATTLIEKKERSVKDAQVRALFPVTAQGDIQLTSLDQTVSRLGLVGHDGQVQYSAPSSQNRYQAVNADAKAQWEQVKADFASVQYEDFYDLLRPTVRTTDRYKLFAQLKRQPTDAEMRAFYLDKLDMRQSFERVKGDLDQWMLAVLERSEGVSPARLRQQKLAILLGLTYLERQYSFKFNGVSAKYLVLLHPEVFGKVGTSSALERLIGIGGLRYADAELANANGTYGKRLAPWTGQASLQGFLDQSIAMFAPGLDGNTWLKQTTKAYIAESQSQRGETRLYEKMRTDNRLNSHLIALLTLSEDSMYVISTMSSVTYGLVDTYVDRANPQTLETLKQDIVKYAQQQENFFDTWYRITDKKTELLQANILVMDSIQRYNPAVQRTQDRWLPSSGAGTLSGVREFVTPLNFYRDFFQAGAEASVDSRYFIYFMSKALSLDGQVTFTHEVTHILDKKVWLNGNDKRTGQWPEVYARGLFEIIDGSVGVNPYGTPVFGLNFSYELGENRTQNASPSRFASEVDLQGYMKGLMDVLYTLDYAEAKASLGKNADDKALLYHQMTLVPDATNKRGVNQVKDQIDTITADKAKNLKTVNDLIEQGMVASRLTYQGTAGTGVVEPNGYYVIPLFDPIYAALQNDAGSVGDLSFRRNAYELLATYGYKGGMIPYLSNQYGEADQAVLQQILDASYGGKLTNFKKAMFQERIDKVGQLKPVAGIANFDELQKLMQEAVDKDLAQIKLNRQNNWPISTRVTAVETLKLRVYQGYLKDTQDFQTSIYQDVESTEKEEELVDIPIEEKTENKSDLLVGKTQVVKGEVGKKRIIRTWKTINGVRQEPPTEEVIIVKPMKPTIIYKGTKPVTTTTKSTTKTTTKSTSKAVTKPVTTTRATTKSTSKSTTRSTTKSTTKSTTRSSTKSSTKPTTKVATKPSTKVTTKATTKRTTKATTKVAPQPTVQLKEVYRLYHSGLKVHLYTTDKNERNVLQTRGWKYEGVSWKTETEKGEPVYRLYHPVIKYHFYTKDANEYKVLGSRGWKQEGIAYRSYGSVPVYRLFHSGLRKHLYTRDANERNVLQTRGWKYEGIAWYSQP